MKNKLKQNLDLVSVIIFYSIRVSIALVLIIFGLIMFFIFINGISHISPKLFEWQYNSSNVSMMSSIINTINMVILSLFIAMPLGVFGAIYLNEYGKKKSKIKTIIAIASETLVGIPSIVYGLFGYLIFVNYFKFGYSFLAGSLTLSIMILPLILRSSQESLRAVPHSFREASFALGCGQLRTIFSVVLPCAIPGILAGTILAIGKIVGESAALLYTSSTVAQVAGLFDSGRTLSLHMYLISSEGLYIKEAYATAMVLILIVFGINILSNFIAKKIARI